MIDHKILHLNMMTATYVEEPAELLDGDRDYSLQPHLPRRAVVYLFCRDAEGKRYIVKDWRGIFKPYCYIPTRSDNKQKIIDFYGRSVRRYETTLPKDVPHVRESNKFTDESDVLFEQRFLIDKKIKCGLKVTLQKNAPPLLEAAPDLPVFPRILFYDSEMDAPDGVDTKKPDDPITLITSFDSYTDKMYAFLYKPPLFSVQEIKEIAGRVVKEWEEQMGNEVSITILPNEFQTINSFINHVGEIDPDIMSGHNADRFDFTYFYRRCQKKGWRIMSKLSPVGKVYLRGEYPVIQGREHIDFCGDKSKHDGLYTNFTVQDTDIDSLRLGELANHDLGYKYRFGKLGGSTSDLWHSEEPNDIFKLLWYGLEDIWVMPMIDRKKLMFERYETVRRIFGCTLRQTLSNSKFIDIGCLRLTDVPLPTKVSGKYKKKGKKKQIEGAVVIRPDVGLHGVIPDE